MKKAAFLLFCSLSVLAVRAAPLSVVNVSAPPINCIFDPSCTVVVEDSTSPVELAGSGTGFLQSRTFRGVTGSPAAGLYAYMYRVDLRNAVGVTNVGCASSVTINFGGVVSKLDYNGDGKMGDQVFVITGGGIGSVGLSSAEQTGSNITFNFASPVCAGGSPGAGQSTFFWGLVSSRPPRLIDATVSQTNGPALGVEARAPNFLFGGRTGGRRRGL